jgi:hypothetical protein
LCVCTWLCVIIKLSSETVEDPQATDSAAHAE